MTRRFCGPLRRRGSALRNYGVDYDLVNARNYALWVHRVHFASPKIWNLDFRCINLNLSFGKGDRWVNPR